MVKLAAPNSSPSFIAVPLLGLFLFQAHALVHKLVLQALEHADHLKLPRRGRRWPAGPPWKQPNVDMKFGHLPRILRISWHMTNTRHIFYLIYY